MEFSCDLCTEPNPRWLYHAQSTPLPADLRHLHTKPPTTDERWYLCDTCLSLYKAGERLKLAGRMLRSQVAIQGPLVTTMPYEEILILCLRFVDYFASVQVGEEELIGKS